MAENGHAESISLLNNALSKLNTPDLRASLVSAQKEFAKLHTPAFPAIMEAAEKEFAKLNTPDLRASLVSAEKEFAKLHTPSFQATMEAAQKELTKLNAPGFRTLSDTIRAVCGDGKKNKHLSSFLLKYDGINPTVNEEVLGVSRASRNEVILSEIDLLHEKIELLFSFIRTTIQSESKKSLIIFYFILPVIANQVSSILYGLYGPTLEYLLKKKTSQKITGQNGIPRVSSDYLKVLNVRVVASQLLNLRQGPKMKYKVITQLNLGRVVRVLEKRKNWTKVEVIENGCRLQGWVFNRYLKKIKV